MTTPPELDRSQLRPRAGCWLFLLPILLTLTILGAYAGLFVAGMVGRPAVGDRVRMEFEGCAEALPLVQERVLAMGLGDPTFEHLPEGFAATATLPQDPEVAWRIPHTLARPGQVEFRDFQGELLIDSAHLDTALVTIRAGAAVTVLQLDREGSALLRAHADRAPDDGVVILIDRVVIDRRPNHPPEPRERFELTPDVDDPRDQTHLAAEWAIILDNGPLPCPVTPARQLIEEPAPPS